MSGGMDYLRDLLPPPITLTPERRALILKLAQADGQPWTEAQAASGWTDHIGEIMYGADADELEWRP